MVEDILVNAAAVFVDGSLELDADAYRSILETNLVAQYAILRTAVDLMKERRNGWIFNIASRAGKYGFAGGGIYGSTKAALIGLTESLYLRVSPTARIASGRWGRSAAKAVCRRR